MVTLKDIGREAGVSPVTVSNVINGNHNKVSQETIKRVNKIIKKYNYVPNATARSLASKKSKIICLIIYSQGGDHNNMATPYVGRMVGVLEKVIRERGYYLMLRVITNIEEAVSILRNWNVDGAMFLSIDQKDIEYIREKTKQPIIFLDAYLDDILDELKIASIGSDDYNGGYLAGSYLLEMGHRKTFFIGRDLHKPGYMLARYQGFAKAYKEAGIEIERDQVIETEITFEYGVSTAERLSDKLGDKTAIFATSDTFAIGLIIGFRNKGLKIPEDISIFGFDNLPECLYSSPNITTIDQNINTKAERAANYLIDFIQKNLLEQLMKGWMYLLLKESQ